MDDRQANGGDDQYYGLHDYDKEQDPQQKDDIQLAEVEDEGEGIIIEMKIKYKLRLKSRDCKLFIFEFQTRATCLNMRIT